MIDSLGWKLFTKAWNEFLIENDTLVPLINKTWETSLSWSDIKGFEKFLTSVIEELPTWDLEDNLRLILAFNKADKWGWYNEQSNFEDSKVQSIMKKELPRVLVLRELEKAASSLLEAVEARKAWSQNAWIKLNNWEYSSF